MCQQKDWPPLILETERLRIFPLPPGLFRPLLEDPSALAARLHLSPAGPLWDGETAAALETRCLRVQRLSRRRLSRGDWHWYVPWLLAERTAGRWVGGACFMGPPGPSGWVELGYGMAAACRGQGYMTEAVTALARWAVEQPKVQAVRAQTARRNPASCRVLEKCGFRVIRVLPAETAAEELLWEYGGRPPVV